MTIVLDGSTGIATPGIINSGALSATTGTFSGAIVATTGTFSEAVIATDGTFSGAVRASGIAENLYPLIRGTAVATTSGTSVSITGVPSWAKRITVMFNSVSTNGTSAIQVQLGDSGGAEITGYVATATGGTTTIATTSSTAGFPIDGGNQTITSSRSGSISIVNVSANLWVASGVTTDATRTTMTGGLKTLSGTLDRINITTVNGTDTFDAGTINIMYEG